MRKSLFFLLIVFILTDCKSKPFFAPVEEPTVEVKEPEFNIISISIIKADLVNTQFEAIVRIDNPNVFALELSSINYESYGNGTFWASGTEQDILHIPAGNSCETQFRFSMNFINMNRKLLDDIIAMRQILYRFTGDVEVEADVPRLPPFQMHFERSGLSEVKEKAEDKFRAHTEANTQSRYFDNW